MSHDPVRPAEAATPPPWRMALGVVLLLAGLVAYWVGQVAPLLDDRGTGVTGLAAHANDYKHLYLGGVMLAEGTSPYDDANLRMLAGEYQFTVDPRFRTILPYVYLPFTGIVMRPLVMLDFPASVVAFQMLNHVVFIAGLLGLLRLAELWRCWRDMAPVGVALLMASVYTPLYRQNAAGQLNVVLFGGMVLLLALLGPGGCGRVAAGGAVAAFLALFKISPGIFGLWFLLRRQWSLAAWMTGWGAVYTAATVALVGWRIHWEFAPVLADMGFGKSTWAHLGQTFWRDPYNQSLNATFHRLMVAHEGSGVAPWLDAGAASANGLTWLAALAVLALFAWRVHATRNDASLLPVAFSLAVLASLLAPSIMWDHYLVQAVIPLVLLAGHGLRGRGCWGTLGLLVGCWLIMAVPLAFDREQWRSGWRVLLMSSKLLPVLVMFGVAVAQSFPRRPVAAPAPVRRMETRPTSTEFLPPHV